MPNLHVFRCIRVSLALVFLFQALACTKKRSETFVQGQGQDLMLITDFDGKEFPVETLGPINEQKINLAHTKSSASTLEKKSLLSEIAAVETKTSAELLQDAPFVALPRNSTDYKIKYRITKDYLVLLKVAAQSKLHPSEIPGALAQDKKLDPNHFLEVPIVGYPIRGFFNVENVDVDGSKSHKLVEVSASDKSAAKYFKIDKNDRVLYGLKEKLDLFTREYFEGADKKSEWYFAQTIVSAGLANSDLTSMNLIDNDAELNTLNKVKFDLGTVDMRAVSVNLDDRVDNKDEVNQVPLVQIPIEWKEYRPAPKGNASHTMSEEENTAIEIEKRRFVKLDFAKASTMTLSSSNWKFVDLEVTKDYFSFTLLEPQYGVRMKQAFMRDVGRAPYVAKRMFKEDGEKFGYFTTQKHEILNFEKYKQEDFGKNTFISRFNTNRKSIVFHFTEGSDPKLIPTAVEAIAKWDKAFEAAGIKTPSGEFLRIEANTTERVRLGDIRYNQINLMRPKIEGNLLGYGPSITDPRTGEIISATTNIQVTAILGGIVSHIREYLRYRSGETKSYSVPVPPPSDLNSVSIVNGKAQVGFEDSEIARFLKKIPVMSMAGQLEMKDVEVKPIDEKSSKKLSRNWGREHTIGLTGKFLNRDIEKLCPELNGVVVSSGKAKDPKNDNEKIFACAEKILPSKLMGTLLHELGHNFGLRHNFYGSVDKINFLPVSVTKTEEQVNSSSVMEYPAFGEDRLSFVGYYDIAAIRFGYGDTVEVLKDGEPSLAKLNTSANIADNLNGRLLKPYMFCTDEDVLVGTDPMCNRFDAGTNPDEVVSNMINEYNESIVNLNYRLGRERRVDPYRLTQHRLRRFWIPFKKIYDEFRYRLNDHLGIGNEFLEGFDKEKLRLAILDKTDKCNDKVDPQSEACQLLYYDRAAKRIFGFTLGLAKLPPKYCIGEVSTKKPTGEVETKKQFVEFADVRRTIMNVNKVVPENCTVPLVKDYVSKKYGFEPTSESGYELEDVRLDMKVKMSPTRRDWFGNPLPEPPDIIGLMPEKAIAMEVLTVRASLSMSSDDKPFKPNFLDEPKHREDVLSYVADRISKGIKGPVLLSGKDLAGYEDAFIEKFKYEKRYIDNMVYSVFSGLEVPEKTLATKQRKKKFLVKYTDKKDILEKAKYKVPGPDGTTYYAIMSEDNSEAKKLLQMLETLPKRMEAASPLTEKTFDSLVEIVDNQLSKEETIDSTRLVEFLHAILDDEFNETICQKKPKPRTKEQLEIDKNRVHWKKLFGIELAGFRPKIQEIYTPGSGEGAGSIMVCDVGDLGAWYATVGKDLMTSLKEKDSNYNLNKPIIMQRIAAFKESASKVEKAKAPAESTSYEELSTQMDLIMAVLRTMTEW